MTDEPMTLYRLRGAEDVLLYVGISANSGRRLWEHATSQPWWNDVTTATFERFPSREAATAAELDAIRSEGPRHNVVGLPIQRGRKVRNLHIKGFPRELRLAARSEAARLGIPLRTFVENAVREEIERREQRQQEQAS
jgi:hypothetical protein